MALAIFDLDETLIAADSDHEWGEYVVDSGLVDAQSHRQRNHDFYEQYKSGVLNIDEYLAFACSVLAQHPLDVLKAHRATFFEERIKPIMLPRAKALVNQHRDKGDTLLVITSTIEFITRPIVDAFGIAILIAPEPELINNRYTGRIVGTPSFAEGKVTRLKQWLEETGESLTGSFFYSDSHNDLPLLRVVDHPVAVDPDPILLEQAKASQWQHISLRQ